MPDPTDRSQEPKENNGTGREDEPLPTASEDQVLDQTARMAREGLQQLESDPKEPKPGV